MDDIKKTQNKQTAKMKKKKKTTHNRCVQLGTVYLILKRTMDNKNEKKQKTKQKKTKQMNFVYVPSKALWTDTHTITETVLTYFPLCVRANIFSSMFIWQCIYLYVFVCVCVRMLEKLWHEITSGAGRSVSILGIDWEDYFDPIPLGRFCISQPVHLPKKTRNCDIYLRNEIWCNTKQLSSRGKIDFENQYC